MITKQLLVTGGFMACSLVALLAADGAYSSKKKAEMRKELPTILPEFGRGQMRGREVYAKLRERGINMSLPRFYHLMSELVEDDVVASSRRSDSDGFFYEYSLLRPCTS